MGKNYVAVDNFQAAETPDEIHIFKKGEIVAVDEQSTTWLLKQGLIKEDKSDEIAAAAKAKAEAEAKAKAAEKAAKAKK